MRQRLLNPPRAEEKMISRLSGVHANRPSIGLLSVVNRFGAPPRVGTTYWSSTRPGPLARRNAMDFPSGEKAGHQSLDSGEGDVSGCREESRNETRVMVGRLSGVESALTARYLPSGDHENSGSMPMCSLKTLSSEYSSLGVPPRAGTT